MKETGKVFGVLQRVGRAFMLPIAVLPVAGLLLGIGRSLTNETMLRAYHLMKIMGPGTVLYGVIKVGSDCGSIIFGNLPLIFAMGVSIGMAKAEKAVAALSGALSFFVMHEAISSMLSLYGDTYTMHAGATDQILGITSLQLGVFGGILVGLGVGYLHNRFYKIKLPEVLSFFGGTRAVPVICTIVYVGVGILMFFIWPPIQKSDVFHWRNCESFRLFRDVYLWSDGTCIDPIWTSSCILSPVLADIARWNDGSCWENDRWGTKYLFCSISRSSNNTF